MSDRLKELQRQRALAQEQVAWFDREIAALSGQPAPPVAPAAPTPPAVPPAPARRSSGTSPAVTAAAQEIISQYQSGTTSVHSEVKKGCFLYFFIALAGLVLAVTAFYFLWLGKK